MFTIVCQYRNDRLHADLWFREPKLVANISSSTMDCTGPCGESDLLELSGSIFVDVHDVVWAVSTMEVDDLCRS